MIKKIQCQQCKKSFKGYHTTKFCSDCKRIRHNKYSLKYLKKTNYKHQKKWNKKNPEKVKQNSKKQGDNYFFSGKRKIILERDNYCCQICGMTREKHFKRYKKDLDVHHIDGNGSNEKKSKDKNNDLDNLITLCCKCHGQVDGWKIRLKGWSRKFKKCLVCGTTERKHYSKGLCLSCYEKTRRKYKRIYWRKNYRNS